MRPSASKGVRWCQFFPRQMLLAIAEAFWDEFGVSIDAHPGGEGNEAGAINRAFRTAVRVILGAIIWLGDDPAAVLTWALRRLAVGRLHKLAVVGPRAEELLDLEPVLGDAWLAYLALAPATVIDDLVGRTERP